MTQPSDDEADDGRAGKRDAGAVADEVAGVVDQLVGILLGDRVGDILDRAGGAAGIIAIFGAEPLIDARRRCRRPSCETLASASRRALEALADQAARLVAGLAGELLAAAADAVGEAAVGRAAAGAVRSPVAKPCPSVMSSTSALRRACRIGAVDHRVGAFGQSGSVIVSFGRPSRVLLCRLEPGAVAASFRAVRGESCTPGARAYRLRAYTHIVTPAQEGKP